MADYNHDVKIQIEAFLKDIGLTDAKKRLDDVATSSRKVQTEFSTLEKSALSLGGSLVQGLAATAVVAFVKTSIVEFAKLDRALSVTAMRLRQMGLDAEASTPQIRAMLQQIQDAGGPVVEETLPAFNRFLGITQDVGLALEFTALAADISEAKLIDLGRATQLVAGLVQGQTRSAKELDIALRKQNGELKTAAELLRDASAAYSGTLNATNDVQDSVDKLHNKWVQFKTDIGSLLSPLAKLANGLLDVADGLGHVINAMVTFGKSKSSMDYLAGLQAKIMGGVGQAGQSTIDLPGLSQKALDFAASKQRGEDAADEEKALFDLMETESKKNAAELKAADRKRKQAEKDHAAEMREYEDRTRAELAWQDEQSKWYEDQDRQLEKAVADWDEYYKMRADLSEGFEKRELERALDYATRGSEEWLNLKYQQLQSYYDKQKEFIEKNIRDEEDRKRLLSQLEKELNDLKTQADREGALQRDQIRQAEKEASVSAAQVVVGALASAFPQVKGFQVAMALLNLLSAAMKAAETASVGGPGAAIAAYAAVFAALIGVISAMKSVSPGSSSAGSGRGGGGGRQRNNVVQFAPNATRDEQIAYYQHRGRGGNATTIVQNFNGTLVDSDQAMKKLNRELRRANRRDDERFIR